MRRSPRLLSIGCAPRKAPETLSRRRARAERILNCHRFAHHKWGRRPRTAKRERAPGFPNRRPLKNLDAGDDYSAFFSSFAPSSFLASSFLSPFLAALPFL